MIEATSGIRPPLVRAANAPPGSNHKIEKLRCSFCRGDLAEGLELTIASKRGQRGSTGSFCSTHCRNCVLALAALHPSPLAGDDFISTRGLLTSRLLELWRQGGGPDPELVLQAAERVSCGLPTVDPAALVKSSGRTWQS